MTDAQRQKVVRLIALYLMRYDQPGAPAGAIGPPSTWWERAEEIVDIIHPQMREFYGAGLPEVY